MSKSLKRAVRALSEAGLDITPLKMPDETRTAQQAATKLTPQRQALSRAKLWARLMRD